MYRTPYGKSFRYKCGFYQQSHGAECAHNQVEGPTTTQFVLSCVRQRALSPQRLRKLERRIQELAAGDPHEERVEQEIAQKRATLSEVEAERDQASRNLARAKTDQQYEAVAAVFDELGERARLLQAEIAAAEARSSVSTGTDSAVDMAIEIVHRLTELVGEGSDLGSAREIFDLVNARLFLGFHSVKVKKRILNRVTGGVVTFGTAPPPIAIYEGPTARRQIKGPAASDAAGPGERHLPSPPESCIGSGREGKSLGNVGRGDWI